MPRTRFDKIDRYPLKELVSEEKIEIIKEDGK